MKITVFVGTRPEIIKMAPIIQEIYGRKNLEALFVHTGQHYDWNISTRFIPELELPMPDIFLNVHSGSHGEQTARTILRSERILKGKRPDVVFIEGDTNSALAVALSAAKLKITIGHVEAGCRSFDKNMPEEINRTIIAKLADLNFAPTTTAIDNLLREGVPKNSIFFTGHPIVDLVSEIKSKISSANVTQSLSLENKDYYLLTLHREENVDDKENLASILSAISKLSSGKTVVFPIHPRTSKMIKKFRFKGMLRSVKVIAPTGYVDMLNLVKNTCLVLTDSGGLQQEAALLKTPCITLRKTTEWVETVENGVNFLVGAEKDKIIETTHFVESNYNEITKKFDKLNKIFGTTGASKRIVDLTVEYVNNCLLVNEYENNLRRI